jgi:type IV pilus assembly protein PilO
MNLRFEKKHTMILVMLALLAILLYIGAYFLYISPLKDSLALKESQLQSEQQLSETLETRLSTASASDFNSTVEMQKMLPVDPMTEQLVLDLEKAEVVSNSYITSMEFNNDGAALSEAQPANGEQPAAADTTSGENQGTETVAADENQIKMPDGIAKNSVTVTVESASYFDLEKFIATLEKLQRVVMVDSISFAGPEEINSLSDEEKMIVMTLTINTFYLSGFDDLKESNPKIEAPEPANKRNPFPTFGDYSEDNLTEKNKEQDRETEENPSEDTDGE